MSNDLTTNEHGVYLLRDAEGEELARLPEPRDLAQAWRTAVEARVADFRAAIAARGGAVAPADHFATMRYLKHVDELLAEYARLFKVVAAEVKALTEEVLGDAVGADDKGTPNASLNVPDAAGDIRVARKFENKHTIDPTSLLQAFAAMFADQHADAVAKALGVDLEAENWLGTRAATGVAIAEAIVDALSNVGELGKFEPQVSKVRAYAEALARGGHDSASSVVSASIVTTREYKGVTVERKESRR